MSSETRPKVLLSGTLLPLPRFEITWTDGLVVGPLQYAKDELREQVGVIADIVVSVIRDFSSSTRRGPRYFLTCLLSRDYRVIT
jgi:hypothetical protein